MDRFDEIKDLYELGNWPSNPNKAFDLSEWLLIELEKSRAENERLRVENARLEKIEIAAIDLEIGIDVNGRAYVTQNLINLYNELRGNPRPTL